MKFLSVTSLLLSGCTASSLFENDYWGFEDQVERTTTPQVPLPPAIAPKPSVPATLVPASAEKGAQVLPPSKDIPMFDGLEIGEVADPVVAPWKRPPMSFDTSGPYVSDDDFLPLISRMPQKVPKRPASVVTKQQLRIAVACNPTTGYNVTMESCDSTAPYTKHLTLLSHKYEPYRPNGKVIVGGGGVDIYDFTALAAGSSCVRFKWTRRWDATSSVFTDVPVSVTEGTDGKLVGLYVPQAVPLARVDAKITQLVQIRVAEHRSAGEKVSLERCDGSKSPNGIQLVDRTYEYPTAGSGNMGRLGYSRFLFKAVSTGHACFRAKWSSVSGRADQSQDLHIVVV